MKISRWALSPGAILVSYWLRLIILLKSIGTYFMNRYPDLSSTYYYTWFYDFYVLVKIQSKETAYCMIISMFVKESTWICQFVLKKQNINWQIISCSGLFFYAVYNNETLCTSQWPPYALLMFKSLTSPIFKHRKRSVTRIFKSVSLVAETVD